jgi:hypothetical protein
VGLAMACMFIPHSSGQRHGRLRYMPDIPQRVSPRLMT